MSWFSRIFGFDECVQGVRQDLFKHVRAMLTLSTTDGGAHVLTSGEGKQFWVGRYTQQSLAQLHAALKVMCDV